MSQWQQGTHALQTDQSTLAITPSYLWLLPCIPVKKTMTAISKLYDNKLFQRTVSKLSMETAGYMLETKKET